MTGLNYMWEHPQFPVGAKYITATGVEVVVLEHSFLSIKLSGTSENPTKPTWVGTNEMTGWIRSGQINLVEGLN